MIFGLLSFEVDFVNKIHLSKSLRIYISIYFALTLFILVPGWLIKVLPAIAAHTPGHAYAVIIQDLCIVFPAFGIISFQLLKNKPVGSIHAGVALLKGLTLCLSWAFSELMAPFFGIQLALDMAVISSLLTIFGIILFTPYVLKLKVRE